MSYKDALMEKTLYNENGSITDSLYEKEALFLEGMEKSLSIDKFELLHDEVIKMFEAYKKSQAIVLDSGETVRLMGLSTNRGHVLDASVAVIGHKSGDSKGNRIFRFMFITKGTSSSDEPDIVEPQNSVHRGSYVSILKPYGHIEALQRIELPKNTWRFLYEDNEDILNDKDNN